MRSGRLAVAALAVVAVAVPALWWIPDAIVARAVVVAAIFLALSLSEAVPPFVPTVVLVDAQNRIVEKDATEVAGPKRRVSA